MSRHFASLIVILVLMVGGVGLAWSVHETNTIRNGDQHARHDLCLKENEVRQELRDQWHRWADLGIPPENHEAEVAAFLAELDQRLQPIDCDNL